MQSEYNRILATLDGSPEQHEVARKAIRLASDHHAHLMLGHVVDAMPTAATGVDTGKLCAEKKGEIEKTLAKELAEARSDSAIASVEVNVVAGDVEGALRTQLIKMFEPDLIVCGKRGLSNLKYAFVGSVSTFLIRHAECDVLVVRQKEESHE